MVLAVAIGVAASAGLALIRGGEFSGPFRVLLWVVGSLMLLMATFSASPSTRQAPGEVSNVFFGSRFLGTDDRGGASMTVVLALAAVGTFGIALAMS